MTFLEKHIPRYLTEKNNIIRQIVFAAFFALVFINIYAPFGVTTWFNMTKLQLFFYSSLMILTGVMVVVLSRIIMYRYCKRKNLTYPGYIGWVAGEIFFMAMVYTILIKTVTDDPREFIEILKKTVEITALVLLLPYLILWLFFALREKNVQLKVLEEIDAAESQLARMIPFYDEKGTLRFSIKRESFLFLEAADNYVTVNYLDGQKISRFMIRNSMKNISDNFPGTSLVRCHRSFMVNFDRVKIIRKEKDGLHLELDVPEKANIPVSKTYIQEVLNKFSAVN
jgi:hypothetical protein